LLHLLSVLLLDVPLAKLIATASVGALFVLPLVPALFRSAREIRIVLRPPLSAFILARQMLSVLLVKLVTIATGTHKLLSVVPIPRFQELAWKDVTRTVLAMTDRSA